MFFNTLFIHSWSFFRGLHDCFLMFFYLLKSVFLKGSIRKMNIIFQVPTKFQNPRVEIYPKIWWRSLPNFSSLSIKGSELKESRERPKKNEKNRFFVLVQLWICHGSKKNTIKNVENQSFYFLLVDKAFDYYYYFLVKIDWLADFQLSAWSRTLHTYYLSF